MPVYNYLAKDSAGKVIKGTQEATSKTQAYTLLKEKGLIAHDIKEQTAMNMDITENIKFLNKLSVKQISIFSKQFSAILKAGIPILKALDLLRKQTENKKLKKVLEKIWEDVQTGSLLSKSMEKQEGIFPSIYINMIEAGEMSGTLETSLDRMAVHFEKEAKIKKKVMGALLYPMIIGVVCVICVTIMMVVVVPIFSQMYADMGAKLPATTTLLLNAGMFMKQKWYIVLLIVIGLTVGFTYFKKSNYGKTLIDKTVLKMPLVSQVIRKYNAAMFTSTLSTLLASGVPILKTFEVLENITKNVIIQEAIKKIKEEVTKGGGLSVPITNAGIFPIMVPQMISIGEESGTLDKMLERTADYYEEEVDAAISMLMTLIEPLLMVVMAIIVGFIVGSILLPMFSIYKQIK